MKLGTLPSQTRSALDSHTDGRTVLLITGRDVKAETIEAFAAAGSQFEIFDEALLATHTVPRHAQSQLQTTSAAARVAAETIRRVNPSAIAHVFDPYDGIDPISSLQKAFAASDLSVCLTTGNLLRSLAISATPAGGQRFLLNGEMEIERFAPGETACYACPVPRLAWRVLPGLVPDLRLMVDFVTKPVAPGKTIIARTRFGCPFVFHLPHARPSVKCAICRGGVDCGEPDDADDFDFRSQADGFYRRVDR